MNDKKSDEVKYLKESVGSCILNLVMIDDVAEDDANELIDILAELQSNIEILVDGLKSQQKVSS